MFDTAGQSVFNQSEQDTAYFENVNFVMYVFVASFKNRHDEGKPLHLSVVPLFQNMDLPVVSLFNNLHFTAAPSDVAHTLKPICCFYSVCSVFCLCCCLCCCCCLLPLPLTHLACDLTCVLCELTRLRLLCASFVCRRLSVVCEQGGV
jgi:hypothetical protein